MITQRQMVAILVGIVSTVISCTGQKQSASSNAPTGAGIFSNRQINDMQDMFMITLAQPALLKVAKNQNGRLVIPAAAKAKLLAEQAAFEARLKELSPDAQIVYRYRMTLNAEAIYTSSSVASSITSLPGVSSVSSAHQFKRPEAKEVDKTTKLGAVNSVNYIGSDQAHALGFTGKGMRVGVIDTGIDYTHAMLGGSGKAADYASIDPSKPTSQFPNDKVVGGIDLVGTDFDASSALLSAHLPHVDANPLDEAGHGSHVAGTIAGRGDGVNTYDGVAPDAKLYAIKVFGKKGSTADAAVIAGFEFAVDPDGNMDPNNHLDAVNLSLGGDFGQPQTLYNEAVNNLSRAGTVVVVSAGNSGPVDYVVGAPSTTDDAISVAASIDGALVNWQFRTVEVTGLTSTPDIFVKAVEGPVSTPIQDAGKVAGELVDLGLSDDATTDAQKTAVKGKIALISRGGNPFADKLKRAVDEGAIGAVVYNNDATQPIPMGGADENAPALPIPAIMVTQAVGLQIKQQLTTSAVQVQFQTDHLLLQPELIDTITDFSSKGPRSEDNLIKPEVAAPGQNVTSAAMGKGNLGKLLDGTSMAAPHMTGTVLLVKQAHPGLSSLEVKSLVMNTAKFLNSKGTDIPITMQGAGRVQVDQAVTAQIVSQTPSLSLGRVQVEQSQSVLKKITLRNLSDKDVTLEVTTDADPGMVISVQKTVTVAAQSTRDIPVTFDLSLGSAQAFTFELDGRIHLSVGGKSVLTIPAMAIRTEASQLSTASAANGGSLSISNKSPNMGVALAFNLLGQELPKPQPGPTESWKNRDCDLQSAGYRIVHHDASASGRPATDVIQFAFKLQQPVTTWITCSVSVLIDSQGSGVADQEIAGVTPGRLEGIPLKSFSTLVLDAATARALRFNFEQDQNAGKTPKVNYTPAVIAASPMRPFNQSTLAVLEAPLSALTLNKQGQLNIKLAAQAEGGETFQSDKFIGGGLGTWIQISPKIEEQGYFGMDELTKIPAGGANITVNKGSGKSSLILYYPLNEFETNGVDTQSQVVN